MNYRNILFYIGFILLVVSFFSILNILYSIYFNFIIDLNSYIITFFISSFVGLIFFYHGKNESKNINLNEQIIFIFLSFTLIPLIISIPYFFSIYDMTFLDSYFESVSGITTTGFTIIKNVNYIDEPLLLWRSSSQWLGGLLFLIAVIGTIGSKQAKIKPSYLISGGASGRNFYKNFNFNFVKIILIYFISTLIVIFLFYFSKVRLFDSFNLAFTAVSSGGFIPTDNLSNILENNLQIFLMSLALLLPIFNFFLFFDIFTKQFEIKNNQEDLHLLFLVIFFIFICYIFVTPNESLINVFFAITSSISTSGLSVFEKDFKIPLFFIILTIIGGSLISTSSGFKYTRFYILLKISYQEIYRLVKPINIIDKNLYNSETKIDDQDVKIAFLTFIIFIISIFLLSSILTLDNLTFENSFKLSILTLTNTVNSSLFAMSNLTFFNLSEITKISLIIFMIIGKIEIITVIYLIKRFIFKG